MNVCGGYHTRTTLLRFLLILVGILFGGCNKNRLSVSINELQGAGGISPLYGQNVTVTGIVSADLQDHSPAGFYVQDDNCQNQNNASCSVFVLAEYDYKLVSLGDKVTLQGYVFEHSRETYLLLQEDTIKIISVDNPIPKTIDLGDILRNSGRDINYESFEGMLVYVSSTQVISLSNFDRSIMVLPVVKGKSNHMLHIQTDLNGMLNISSNKFSARLNSAKKGDFLENLFGVLRQDGDTYILHLLNPDQVTLLLGIDHDLIIDITEENEINGSQLNQDLDPINTLLPTMTITPYPVNLLLAEIFPNPIGKEPDGEWIEIFNPGISAIPLTGVKVGDESSQGGKEGMLRFPDGYFIEAKEVLVVANRGAAFRAEYGFSPDFEVEDSDDIIPDLLPYDFWGGEKIQFSNSGDEVILLDPWDQIIDGIGYGNSEFLGLSSVIQSPKEGNSLERYPPERDRDKASDWRERNGGSPGKLDRSPPTQVILPSPSPEPTPKISPSPTLTPTLDIPSPTPVWVELLLSEIMFNPRGEEPGGEWFEIFNPENRVLPLTGVKVGDAANPGDPEGMYEFPGDELISPEGIILIAHRSDLFEVQYGFKPDYELINTDVTIADLTPYNSWAGGTIRLGNQGDELVLLNGWDELVDSLCYGDSDFHIFQPSVQIGAEGSSLSRYPMTSDTDHPADWYISKNPSPGKMNPGLTTQTPVPTTTPVPTVTPTNSTSPILPTKTAVLTTQPGLTISPSRTMVYSLTPTTTDAVPTSSLTVTPTPSSTRSYTPLPSLTPVPLSSPTIVVNNTPTLELIKDEKLVINEIHADPHPTLGDANRDGSIHSDDDEFLEIINKGETALDISNWEIRDLLKSRWIFPENTILPRNGCVVVFGGGSPDGDFGECLVHIASSLGLNNNGDVISVFDGIGILRIKIAYGGEANQNQSLTLSPDITGNLPFSLHGVLPDANGALFSPGTKVDGMVFGE